MLRLCLIGLLALAAVPAPAAQPAPPPQLSLLIVDGVNNHDWPRATRILKGVPKKWMHPRDRQSRMSDGPICNFAT
jgi:hypothetical protein